MINDMLNIRQMFCFPVPFLGTQYNESETQGKLTYVIGWIKVWKRFLRALGWSRVRKRVLSFSNDQFEIF